MLILANALALALIADAPVPPPAASAPASEGFTRIDGRFGPVAPEPEGPRHLTLAEAIRIGLENTDVVRFLPPEPRPAGAAGPAPEGFGREKNRADVAIARANTDLSTWDFKAAVMAHVRSVEQQYWALAMFQANVRAREAALATGREILRHEKADLAHGKATAVTVAEAEQQIENFQLNLISAASDVTTAERQLRNIIGLPAAESRPIELDTAPADAKVEPDWEACLAQMRAAQPELARQESLIRLGELQLAVAKDGPLAPLANGPGVTPIEVDEAERQLARQRSFHQQVLHQTTHSLARFTLEIDANFKQFETARRLRVASAKRLKAQRSLHEEGGLTIDRVLDAVSQYANAVSQEAMYRSSYNTSIVALEEAKGTLLAYDGITVLDRSPARKPAKPKDDQVAPAAYSAPKPEPARPASASYKLRARIGTLEFEAEVEVDEIPPAKPGR